MDEGERMGGEGLRVKDQMCLADFIAVHPDFTMIVSLALDPITQVKAPGCVGSRSESVKND